jgi:hypothetical protein
MGLVLAQSDRSVRAKGVRDLRGMEAMTGARRERKALQN